MNVVKNLVEEGAAINLNDIEITDLFYMALGNMKMVIYLDEIFSIRYDLNGKLFINKAFIIEDFDLIKFLLDHGCEVGSDIVQSFQKQETPFMKFLKKKSNKLVHFTIQIYCI